MAGNLGFLLYALGGMADILSGLQIRQQKSIEIKDKQKQWLGSIFQGYTLWVIIWAIWYYYIMVVRCLC